MGGVDHAGTAYLQQCLEAGWLDSERLSANELCSSGLPFRPGGVGDLRGRERAPRPGFGPPLRQCVEIRRGLVGCRATRALLIGLDELYGDLLHGETLAHAGREFYPPKG